MPSGWVSLSIPINNKINQTHAVRPAGTGPRELLASKVIIFSLPYFSLEHETYTFISLSQAKITTVQVPLHVPKCSLL